MSETSYPALHRHYTDIVDSSSQIYPDNPQFYFYVLLGVAQDMQIDFLPITHQAALGELGHGSTCDIRQIFINPEFYLVFKRLHRLPIALNEIIIYTIPQLRHHTNILQLQGISWEVFENDYVLPNLVFEKAGFGDCGTFLNSDRGRRLSIEDRLKICSQIAAALGDLHRAHVVHGDIKPQNILIFPSEDGELLAKIGDFGFSSYTPIVDTDHLIHMPKSEPWNAPEHHYRGFPFGKAVKMDIFSFGRFCLWLLFQDENTEQADQSQSADENVDPDDVSEMAQRRLALQDHLMPDIRKRLRLFFSLTLARTPDERASCMDEITILLQPRSALTPPLPKPRSIHEECFDKPRLIIAARFQIANALPQLFDVDFRVRRAIFTCLGELLEQTQAASHRETDLNLYMEIAYQLAFCYKFGFGVPRNDEQCQAWLAKSGRPNSDLEDQLQVIKSSIGRNHSPSLNFGLWFQKGHVPMASDAQYYRERNQLKDIQIIEEREISDWKVVLGDIHWLVVSREASHYHLLQSLGFLDKAELLARESCQLLSSTLPQEDHRVLRARSNLASACISKKNYDEAEREIIEVLDLSEENSQQYLILQDLLASVYSAQGKAKKSIRLRLEVYKQMSATLGESHLQTLSILWNLREDHFRARRFVEAENLSLTLVETATKSFGEHHELTVRAMAGLVQIHWSKRNRLWGYFGAREKSEVDLDLIRKCQSVLGEDHPITMDLVFHTARSLVYKSNWGDAISVAEQVVEHSTRIAGPDHALTIERKKWLEFVKASHWWYSVFQKLGSFRVGNYVITPSFKTRHGLERAWGPIYRRKDTPRINLIRLILRQRV